MVFGTDATDYVPMETLSQQDDERILRLMAYFPNTHTPAECNYDIDDKELVAIMKVSEEWRPERKGAAHKLQLSTGYDNLEYCVTKELLDRRQTRWCEFVSRFDYEIIYSPGKSNGKVDKLTSRPGDLHDGGDEGSKSMEQVVSRPNNVLEQL